MTNEKVRDLLSMIEVKEPNELIVNSWWGSFVKDYKDALQTAIKALEQEPKTGHWIVHPKGIYARLVCDKCLSCAPYNYPTNYCPNCGAKMEVSEC